MFFYFKHFTFILQHLVLIVKNTFSHSIICMFDEIIKKLIIILHSNQKNLFLPQKITSSNLEGKQSLMRVFCKHHGLNYFGPGYWKGISYA